MTLSDDGKMAQNWPGRRKQLIFFAWLYLLNQLSPTLWFLVQYKGEVGNVQLGIEGEEWDLSNWAEAGLSCFETAPLGFQVLFNLYKFQS